MTAPIPPERERALSAGRDAFAIAWGTADGTSAMALAEHTVAAIVDAVLAVVDLPGRDARVRAEVAEEIAARLDSEAPRQRGTTWDSLRKAADYAREHATAPKETPDA